MLGRVIAPATKGFRFFKEPPSVATHPFSEPLLYIMFQTELLKCAAHTSEETAVIVNFKWLCHQTTLFTCVAHQQYQACIEWLHRTGMRSLQLKAFTGRHKQREIAWLECYEDNKLFATLIAKKPQRLLVIYASRLSEKKWNEEDIKALVINLNEVIKAKKIVFKRRRKKTILNLDKRNKSHSEYLSKWINKYCHQALTYRLQQSILRISIKTDSHFEFRMHWPVRSQSYELKAIFSRTDAFENPKDNRPGYSWVFTEDSLIRTFPAYRNFPMPCGQFYYSLKIYEAIPVENNTPIEILKIWFTLDGKVGELCDVKKGKQLSGNDVLQLFHYFDQLFQIETTFLCDASALESSIGKIPLRLISALVTGKTWYEMKVPGLKLFECEQFSTPTDGLITQHQAEREQALYELQTLKLSNWLQLLNHRQQPMLRALVRRFLDDKTNPTLKDLTEAIYLHAKQQQKVTYALYSLIQLLCGEKGYVEKEVALDKHAANYWVKSRVNSLLRGSLCWYKELQEPVSRKSRNRF